MTFGNDKLTNLFPPLITLEKNLKNTRKKFKISIEISAGD